MTVSTVQTTLPAAAAGSGSTVALSSTDGPPGASNFADLLALLQAQMTTAANGSAPVSSEGSADAAQMTAGESAEDAGADSDALDVLLQNALVSLQMYLPGLPQTQAAALPEENASLDAIADLVNAIQADSVADMDVAPAVLTQQNTAAFDAVLKVTPEVPMMESPGNTATLAPPQWNAGTTETMPATETEPPATPSASPAATQPVPAATQTVPVATQIVPVLAQAAPSETQAVPVTVQSAPIPVFVAPVTAETVPVTAKTTAIPTNEVPEPAPVAAQPPLPAPPANGSVPPEHPAPVPPQIVAAPESPVAKKDEAMPESALPETPVTARNAETPENTAAPARIATPVAQTEAPKVAAMLPREARLTVKTNASGAVAESEAEPALVEVESANVPRARVEAAATPLKQSPLEQFTAARIAPRDHAAIHATRAETVSLPEKGAVEETLPAKDTASEGLTARNHAFAVPAEAIPASEGNIAAKADAPTPLSEPATLKTVVVHAARNVRYLVTEGGQTITMRLEPESLGEMHIEVHRSGDDVSVRLISASAAVRETLEAQMPHLRESLVREGIQPGKIEIAAELGQAATNTGGQASQQTAQHQQSFGRHASPSLSRSFFRDNNPVVPTPRRASAHDGALNLFA